MLRSVALAMSILSASCALTTEQPPAGTTMVQSQVRNRMPEPAELTVTTPAGVLAGAVQPVSVPPGSTANVTLYVPTSGEWAIAVNGRETLGSTQLAPEISSGCTLGIDLQGRLGTTAIAVGCLATASPSQPSG